MDRRERRPDKEETLRMLFESSQAGLWTAIPVVVESVNLAKQTCVLQPTVQCRVRQPDGSFQFTTLPLLLDCPIIFPTGGGFTLTFPVAKGDEGLAIFSSRCIDGWWQNGGVQAPPEIRLHDLSDGFYLPGCRSNPRALGAVSSGTAQLRSDDGNTYVEIASGGIVNIKAPTEINLNSPVVNIAGIIAVQNENSAPVPCTINGKVSASGDVVANSTGSAISLVNHVHLNGGGVGNSGAATG